ncbi:DNA repair protein REV1 isoform X2 [Brienomyrus brachyistius]|uniref:DNA repair protein REV1 isoform X2 n=1 Tax=Brienomyrus brachyistius TaxID=42636 RepID=UPI0020B22C7E|nr:DNA repair protein REV1 isoform X2 [Brienomyrus brachyistius]
MSRGGWRKRASEDDGWGGRGGYMAAKVSKLEEQFKLDAPREKQKEGASSSIFSGVAIYVNGYTDPSADELRRLMMLHGGQYHVYYSRSKTTHIIATNLPNTKIKELRGEKVVRPDWITDSIKAGHLLSYLKYQLYAKHKGLSFPSIHLAQERDGPGHSHYQSGHTPKHIGHAPSLTHQDFKLNGTDLSLGLRLNGMQKVGGDPPSLAPPSSIEGALERTLTNGHSHPMNGALKPHDPMQGPIPQDDWLSQRPRAPPPASHVTGTVETTHLLPPGGQTISPQDMTRQVLGPEAGSTRTHAPQPSDPKPALAQKLYPQAGNPEGPPTPTRSVGRFRLNGAQHLTPQGLNPLPHITLNPGDSLGGEQVMGTDSISEYYSHSRLHHISTWRSEFSEYVSSLQYRTQTTGGTNFPGRERLRRQRMAQGAGSLAPPGPQARQPCILHVDMDCFFVSVGIRHRPDLNGKPVAVTSNRGRGQVAKRPGANPQLEMRYYQQKLNPKRAEKGDGDLEVTPSPESPNTSPAGTDQDLTALSMAEIASCSYEARQAGVRNGMFFGQAKQLCPGLQAVPYDFEAYKEVATAMYETLASYTHHIEALSCDEALMDATSLLAELSVSPHDLAITIRADVRDRTGCSASVGMGSNILLARMATRKAKPDGQYYLKPEEVDDFIRDQSVTNLPGVGRAMGFRLASLGVRSCGDLQQLSMSRLQREFGPRTGQTLFRFCRGLDDRPVRSEKERKSVSAEMNYGIRFTQVAEAETFLTKLSQEVQRRLQASQLRGRRITLKVMVRKAGAPLEPAKFGGHGICDSLGRTVTIEKPTDCAQVIAAEAIRLFQAMKVNVTDVRGVGLQVQQLVLSHSGPPGSPGPAGGAGLPRRSIRDMLLVQRPPHPDGQRSSTDAPAPDSPLDKGKEPRATQLVLGEPAPGTSKGVPQPRHNGSLHTPRRVRKRLDLSIEVPSPSQVDRSVLEALPAELREQVERSWGCREEQAASSPPAPASSSTQSTRRLVLQIPGQHSQTHPTDIVLALPDFSQVDPEVLAALPQELQEELRSAYRRRETVPPQVESRNPLLQLRQATAGRAKRRYKRKNTSPAKAGPSPLKGHLYGNSPAKSSPAKPVTHQHMEALKLENGPSTSSPNPDMQEKLVKVAARPGPTLAGACEFTDIRTLLKEWVTTIPEPMEEDILQVVKYCTELVEDKDLEKLDLVIKYMKRLMQQSVESVWNMAFDFILDNVQVVIQQTYGSTLKIT